MIPLRDKYQAVPELLVDRWFNTPEPVTLTGLRGKVIVIEAFQMLCPGCVSHGLPQAIAIREAFPREEVEVIGIHTVFEHHAAMTPVSLEAFLHEYGIGFPVAVDRPGDGDIPETMKALGLRGTPSLVVLDRRGFMRINLFGRPSDMLVAAEIARLVFERGPTAGQVATAEPAHGATSTCKPEGCKAS